MALIELKAYNSTWSIAFNREVSKFHSILLSNLITAYHIGSTAIIGIHAKPIIDILLEVQSNPELDVQTHQLEQIGYESKGEFGIKGRRYFAKDGDRSKFHVHAFESANPEIDRHVLFVEYMNTHPIEARAYEKLKFDLVARFQDEPEAYSNGKSQFIQNIDQKALQWKFNRK
jgi:GrpB-like predicted nucleotidyltransferase (UPF0157 family)